MTDWESARYNYSRLIQSGKTRADKDKIRAEQAPSPVPFADRCWKLAQKYPHTQAEVIALWWAVCKAPDAKSGQDAYHQLEKEASSADLGALAAAFDTVWEDSSENSKPVTLAPIILERVKQEPNHAKAARLLNWVCTHSCSQFGHKDLPRLFREAADLIEARYPGSPDITNFCECLGMGTGSPSWAGRYEKHLRTILKENRNRRPRGGALFALASVVQFTGGEARQDEADKLYQQYLSDFDGSDPENGSIEKVLRKAANAAREEFRWRAVGKLAPEIDGVDLVGRPLKLSHHHGKVVLLSFWETPCLPCMKLLPHEKALLDRLRDKPFALLGVNCDADEQAAKDTLRKHKIAWPCFRNKQGSGQTISNAWDVLGFPTLYLIDEKGIIRQRWVGAPSPEELNRAVDDLLEKVTRKDK